MPTTATTMATKAPGDDEDDAVRDDAERDDDDNDDDDDGDDVKPTTV